MSLRSALRVALVAMMMVPGCSQDSKGEASPGGESATGSESKAMGAATAGGEQLNAAGAGADSQLGPEPDSGGDPVAGSDASNPEGEEPITDSSTQGEEVAGAGGSSAEMNEPAASADEPKTSGGEPGAATAEPAVSADGGPAAPEPQTEPDVSTADPSSARLTAVPIGEGGAPLGYWEYLPPGYDGSAPVPLLVFTHGASWQGSGSLEDLQKLLKVGPPNLISTDAWPNERPFLVLSPQNPRSGCFDPDDIDAFYHHALDTYQIDPARIYHTGQSCGAIGAWGYLADHLDEFVTAAVLISGDGRDAFAQAGCDLGRIAIWGFHNENDATVNSVGTIEPINDLLECSPTPDVQLTIYPGETAHDAWTKTYDLSAGHDIYSWFLDHTHP